MCVPSPRLRLLSEISLTAASKLSPPAVFSDVPAGSEVSTVNLSLSLSLPPTYHTVHWDWRTSWLDVPQHPQSAPICLLGSLSAVGVGKERERERDTKHKFGNVIHKIASWFSSHSCTQCYESSNTVPFVQGIGSFQTRLWCQPSSAIGEQLELKKTTTTLGYTISNEW